MCLVKDLLLEEDIAEADFPVALVRHGEYIVPYADVLLFICGQVILVIDSMEALPATNATNILNYIANLFAGLYSGIKRP